MSDDDFVQGLPKNSRFKKKQLIQEESDSELDSNSEKGDQSHESDMFASDDEEPINETKRKKNAAAKRMDMDQFEREAEINVDERKIVDLEESETKFELFDLRNEQEEGYFDEDGNYVRHPQDEDEDEEWLDNIDNQQIQKALAAENKRQRNIDDQLQANDTKEQLYKLIEILEPDETPLEALARFAPKRQKKKSKVIDSNDNFRKQTVMDITEACDKLMIQKGMDVYDLVREELMRWYQRENGEEWAPRGVKRKLRESQDELDVNTDSTINTVVRDEEPKIWHFKWHNLDEINGPYSEYEMSYWKDNYFEDAVQVKRIDQDQFQDISKVTFNTNTQK